MSYKTNLSIKTWAEEDRPREKLILKGKSVLSDAELIAILIGSGTKELTAVELSRNILAACQNNLNNLAKLGLKDLTKFHGIGEAKAVSIISALELGRRRKEQTADRKPTITSSNEAYCALKPHLSDLKHEEFWILLLNKANQLLKMAQISSGGLAGTVADIRMMFKQALEESATSIVVAHNHPSGNLRPSEQDYRLTQRIKSAGQTLDIPLIDHIIFTDHGYFSFADESRL